MQADPFDNELYYFVAEHKSQYPLLFLSWILKELVLDFKKMAKTNDVLHAEIQAQEHRFICTVDCPVYLINIDKDVREYCDNDDSFELTSDNADVEITKTVRYPQSFHNGISSLFDYKLYDELYRREGDLWIPLNV